jgi:UDP-N-acetylmuramoyl-L-alanyl-D-glutamate--2,6-diaminopimelate ligase
VGALPTRFRWRGQNVELPMPGEHNVYNALAAAETAVALGVPARQVAESLARVPQVPGRFEILPSPQDSAGTPGTDAPTVVVDFAHTPDALEAALRTARGVAGDSAALWVVFGCGGDRDRGKRPHMGAVASGAADHVVLTNDNPRSEDPLSIIDAVRSGCVGDPIVEPDRRRAIELAVSRAGSGDVVLIAGKGHEQGQVFAERTEPFDDREVAQEGLATRMGSDGGGS